LSSSPHARTATASATLVTIRFLNRLITALLPKPEGLGKDLRSRLKWVSGRAHPLSSSTLAALGSGGLAEE
jgi:hypothetical protein